MTHEIGGKIGLRDGDVEKRLVASTYVVTDHPATERTKS
jgi:hypothetical protein